MKLASTAFALLAAAAVNAAQTGPVELEWSLELGAEWSWADEAQCLDEAAGRVFLAAHSQALQGGGDAITIQARDLQSGVLLWERERDEGLVEAARAMRAAPDGSALYLGGSRALNSGVINAYDLLLQRIDPSDGSLVWEQVYDAGGGEWVGDLALSPDGQRIYVFGRAQSGSFWGDLLVQARSTSDGSLLWSDTIDGPSASEDFPIEMALSPDGTFLHVLGQSAANPVSDWLTATYIAPSGVRLWTRIHAPVPTSGFPTPTAIASDPTGSLVVVGGIEEGGNENLIAYDVVSGAEVWKRNVEMDVRDLGCDLDDALYLSGRGDNVDGATAAAARHSLSTGAPIWFEEYDAMPGQPTYLLQASVELALPDADGVLPVVSQLMVSLSDTDVALLRHDAQTGALLSVQATSGNDLDVPLGLRRASDGSLLTAGTLNIAGEEDALWSRLDAGGAGIQWNHVFDSSNQAEGAQLEPASGGGRLFLATAGLAIQQEQARLRAFDSAGGGLLWERVLSTHPTWKTLVRGVAAAPDGERVYVIWRESNKTVLEAFDGADGSSLWQIPEDPGAGWGAFAWSVNVDPSDSTLVIAGRNVAGQTFLSAYAAADGAPLWERTLTLGGTSNKGLQYALDLSADTLLVVARDNASESDLRAEALRTTDGQPLWVWGEAAPSPTHELSEPQLALAASDQRYVLGFLRERTDPVAADPASSWELRSIDAQSGAVLGSAQFAPSAADELLDSPRLALSPFDARVAFCAQAAAPDAPPRLVAASWSSDLGAQLWARDAAVGTQAQPLGLVYSHSGDTLALCALREALGALDAAPSWSLHGLDAHDGATRWQLEQPGVGGGLEPWGIAGPDPAGRILCAAEVLLSPEPLQLLSVRPRDFHGQPELLSVSNGGSQALELHAGPALAGQAYLVLGSLSGTAPGLPLDGGQVLPLVLDDYLLLSAADPLSSPVVGNLGVLDAQGRANASFVLPPGSTNALIGLPAAHAYVVLGALGLDLVSEPVELELAP